MRIQVPAGSGYLIVTRGSRGNARWPQHEAQNKSNENCTRSKEEGDLLFLYRTVTAERLIQICNTINPLTSMLLGWVN